VREWEWGSGPERGGERDDRGMLEMTEIEKRVARLETLVGDGDVADLYPDLCSALDALEARVALVDPATLKAVGKQITELEARLVAAEGVPEGQGGEGTQTPPRLVSLLLRVVSANWSMSLSAGMPLQ